MSSTCGFAQVTWRSYGRRANAQWVEGNTDRRWFGTEHPPRRVSTPQVVAVVPRRLCPL